MPKVTSNPGGVFGNIKLPKINKPTKRTAPKVASPKVASPVLPVASPSETFGTTKVTAPTLLKVKPPKTNNLTLEQASNADLVVPILYINELTGHQRRVQLSGRALPFKNSLKFVAKQRIDEGEYTGFPRVNQTVLGAREGDTEWNGCWHDRFLGDPDSPTQAGFEDAVPEGVSVSADSQLTSFSKLLTARDLVDIFEALTYEGPPLRVSWLHIRRIGRIESFEHNWLNPHDVEWKINWKWISRDEQVGLPSPARTQLVGLAQAFHSAYTDVHAGTDFDGLSKLDPSFADRIDRAVGRLQGSITDISDAVETRVSAVTDTAAALRRATATATLVRDQAQQLIDSLDSVVYPAMLAVQHPGSIIEGNTNLSPTSLTDLDFGRAPRLVESLVDQDAGQTIAAACQNRAAVQLARRMKHVAARQRFSALRSLDSNSIGTVMVREGQDLRDLAADWLGDPESWDVLRRYNGLDVVSPPAGTIIFIPAPGAR